MKLDRSKPFGTVHGVSGASYEQAGVLFDHEGVQIVGDEPVAADPVEPEVVVKKKPGRPPKASAEAIDPQLASQLSA